MAVTEQNWKKQKWHRCWNRDGKNINALGENSDPQQLMSANGVLYFFQQQMVETEPIMEKQWLVAGALIWWSRCRWRSGLAIQNITAINNVLSDWGIGCERRHELWKSDGSDGGSTMVKDIYAGSMGSDANEFVNISGLLFFRAQDGPNGMELWKSDGTVSGTNIVKDINPVPVTVTLLNSPISTELFISSAYTVNDGVGIMEKQQYCRKQCVVKNISPGFLAVMLATHRCERNAYSSRPTRRRLKLWTLKIDGTETGTVLVKRPVCG